MIEEKIYIIDRSNEPNPSIIFDYDYCEKQLKKMDALLNELDSMVSKKYAGMDYEIPKETQVRPDLSNNQGIVGELELILNHMPSNLIPRRCAA